MGAGQRPFLHISGMYPAERGCLGLVWPLAPHPTNKNELIVWDLAHDPAELLALDADTLRLRMFSKTADLPEGLARLPVKTIHINKSPVVIGNLKTLPPALAERWGLDMALGLRHAAWAAAHGAELQSLPWAAVFQRPAPAHAPDVDEDLYGGFIGPGDRRTLDRLRGLGGCEWWQHRQTRHHRVLLGRTHHLVVCRAPAQAEGGCGLVRPTRGQCHGANARTSLGLGGPAQGSGVGFVWRS